MNNERLNELIEKEFSVITPTSGMMAGREIIVGTISKSMLKRFIKIVIEDNGTQQKKKEEHSSGCDYCNKLAGISG